MTQQQGGARPVPTARFPQHGTFLQRGFPHGTLPQPPHRPSTLRLVFLALAVLAVLCMGGLALAVVAGRDTAAAYQNDGYTVPPPDTSPPPIPRVNTIEEARQVVARNPIYGQTAPIPVRCDAQPINIADAGDDHLQAHFADLIECLVRVWQPPVTGAGFQIVRPTVIIYGSTVTTTCGTFAVDAIFCGADQQIYYSNRFHELAPVLAEQKWAGSGLMAHEFGHAIQARTGVFVAARLLAQQSGDEQTRREFMRRMETQADCFSGMFIRSVSHSLGVQQSDLPGIEATYLAAGDDTRTGDPRAVGDHGRGETRKYWGLTGLGTSDIGQCNTFIAPPHQVR